MSLASRALVALFLLLVGPALAETRVALVVANAAYEGAPLANPTTDAALVAPVLERMGFSVETIGNADFIAFSDAVDRFASRAKGADVALFYFAGHGFALQAERRLGVQNYLMATSADMTAKDDRVLRRDGIPLDDIVGSLAEAAKTSLVFVDACRKDPAVRSAGGAGRGLTRVPDPGGENVFVGLSTRLGDVAADGEAGEGSPFARAFATHIPTPGLRLDDAFTEVRKAVITATGGDQRPEAARDDLDRPLVLVNAVDAATEIGTDGAEGASPSKAPGRRLPAGWTYDLAGSATSLVGYLAFSLQAPVLASASTKGIVRLWDAEAGKAAATWRLDDDIQDLAFGPDGRSVAIALRTGKAVIRDIADERALVMLATGDGDKVHSIAFSPDGRWVAGGLANRTIFTILLWDAATGAIRDRVTSILDSGDSVDAIAFGPNGWLASASGNRVVLWRLDDASPGPAKPATSLEASTIRLVEHRDNVYGIAFSPDGRLIATGSRDQTVKLWDVATGKVTRALIGHAGPVDSLAFSPDGKLLATASWDGTVRLWSIDPGKAPRVLVVHDPAAPNAAASGSAVSEVAFSPDGRLLAGAVFPPNFDRGLVALWDVARGEGIGTFVGYDDGEWAAVLHGALATSSAIADDYVTVRRADGSLLPLVEHKASTRR